jgi:hypothetical protein
MNTELVEKAQSAYQARLEKKQAALAAKNKNHGGAPPRPILFAQSLEPVVLGMLTAAFSADPETGDVLAATMRAALKHLGEVIASDPSNEARTKAANTTAWIVGQSWKYSAKLERAKSQTAIAEKKRAFNEAAAARAQRDTNEAVILIGKKRKKIQDTLDRIAPETLPQETKPTAQTFVLPADVAVGSRLAKLLLKQHDARERHLGETNGNQVTA